MSTSFSFDYLPADVLSLSGYDFFLLIKTVLGEPEANLLNKISIKSTTSLIQTEDPLDIFNYDIDDEELEKLKEELSFKLKNKKFVLKPGIDFDENIDVRASIKCKCNKLISLGKNDNKIQVSSYYKHLQSNGYDHMKNVKKVARELKSSQQQQQPSTPITLTPSCRSQTPLIGVAVVSPTNTQTTAQVDSSAFPNQAAHNGSKRRLISQSQQYRSTKRSRI
ncbi:unnamed protein product [Rotaria sordida]|uniref:Uncharacterized protein n=3 Tax=Rotaria sordida TaxID=392033 RepID=A0A815DSV8_9BILA|nr:unnamed protein product [Rotaria sordida]